MSTPNPLPADPARLAVREEGPHEPLVGAWWPRSRDLAAEIPRLVESFPVEIGRVARILYSTPDWDTRVRKTWTHHGMVKLGTFPDDDTHTVVLVLTDRTRLHLLVIPHDVPAALAESLMDAAILTGNHRSAEALLAEAGVPLPRTR